MSCAARKRRSRTSSSAASAAALGSPTSQSVAVRSGWPSSGTDAAIEGAREVFRDSQMPGRRHDGVSLSTEIPGS